MFIYLFNIYCYNIIRVYTFHVHLSDKDQWETVETTGHPPSPRTCHSMASVGSKFYVFGGGLSGPEPVPDNTVHAFNAGEPLLSELLPYITFVILTDTQTQDYQDIQLNLY